MEPEKKTLEEESVLITGDVIGDTAYSERFVLKILLKLANLDTLKDEILESSFENDLCTLWDMSTERDVVLFLQKHDVLKLFNFCFPIIESPRIIEIMLGVIGNMCCQREAVESLLTMEAFLKLLLEYIKSDDALILVQLLRLVKTAIFSSKQNDISTWMSLFENVGYSEAMYFIMKNSSNYSLLCIALENFNTVIACCNIESTRSSFFTHFVKLEAFESPIAAFTEIFEENKDSLDSNELERITEISLQMIIDLTGFEDSLEISWCCRDSIISMIRKILVHYYKLINQYNQQIYSCVAGIIDSINTITCIFKLSEISDIDSYFRPCYNMWRVLHAVCKHHQNQNSNSDGKAKSDAIVQTCKEIILLICISLCEYLIKCSDNRLLPALNTINDDYESILSGVESKDICEQVSERTFNYRTKIKNGLGL